MPGTCVPLGAIDHGWRARHVCRGRPRCARRRAPLDTDWPASHPSPKPPPNEVRRNPANAASLPSYCTTTTTPRTSNEHNWVRRLGPAAEDNPADVRGHELQPQRRSLAVPGTIPAPRVADRQQLQSSHADCPMPSPAPCNARYEHAARHEDRVAEVILSLDRDKHGFPGRTVS